MYIYIYIYLFSPKRNCCLRRTQEPIPTAKPHCINVHEASVENAFPSYKGQGAKEKPDKMSQSRKTE